MNAQNSSNVLRLSGFGSDNDSDTQAMAINRHSSSSSLLLLDSELDDSDVFDPPAWRPGRFLQFADISLQDEPALRPVSLSAERVVPAQRGAVSDSNSVANSDSDYVIQVDAGNVSARHWRPPRRTVFFMTACLAVALTALTVLNMVL